MAVEPRRITEPNAEGAWWIRCSNGEREVVTVLDSPRGLLALVREVGGGPVRVPVSRFTWIGPVNPEPLPMPEIADA